jgi:NADH-quinone oxidoreductase subunit J
VIVPQIAFWMLAGFTAVATLGVVVTRNVVHSALALAASLLGAAGLFILFGAEFVGLAQILIYVGAVVILFLFGIMLTSASAGRPVIDNEQPGVAALVALGVFVVLAIGIIGSYGRRRLSLDVAFSTTKLGTALFTRWILPFEAVSVLLLAALIGAIVLARKD